jgi:hypothetical protein
MRETRETYFSPRHVVGWKVDMSDLARLISSQKGIVFLLVKQFVDRDPIPLRLRGILAGMTEVNHISLPSRGTILISAVLQMMIDTLAPNIFGYGCI